MSDDAAPQTHPDYRFSLANERTFLAYVRTALALDAAALAVEQFLTDLRPSWLRTAMALVLVGAGAVVAVSSFLRWHGNQQAIDAGVPLPATALPLIIAVGTGLAALGAVALVIFG